MIFPKRDWWFEKGYETFHFLFKLISFPAGHKPPPPWLQVTRLRKKCRYLLQTLPQPASKVLYRSAPKYSEHLCSNFESKWSLDCGTEVAGKTDPCYDIVLSVAPNSSIDLRVYYLFSEAQSSPWLGLSRHTSPPNFFFYLDKKRCWKRDKTITPRPKPYDETICGK